MYVLTNAETGEVLHSAENKTQIARWFLDNSNSAISYNLKWEK